MASADTKFSKIPHWILQTGMSSGAIHLYVILAKYADNTTRQAFPSRQTLAKDLGKNVKAVDRALKELVKAGAVSITKRKKAGTDGHYSSLYTLLDRPEVMAGDPLEPSIGVGTKTSPGRDANGTLTRPTELDPLNTSFTSDETSDDHKETFTSEQSPNTPNPGNLTRTERNQLRNKLKDVGTSMITGTSFHDDAPQEAWEDFTSLMETILGEDYDKFDFADMLDNQKWSIGKKQADPYEAGIKLSKMLHVGFGGEWPHRNHPA